MPRVVHFEIHATDPDSLVAFYSRLFGWTFTAVEGMDYWLIETGPQEEPGIDGGLVRRPVPGPADSPALGAYPCSVNVESLDDTLALAGDLGAQEALPKMPVTGVGWLAYIKDPDGNVLGLLQMDPDAA
jgi:hypothetical protein